jgi:hypothetical protein
MTVALKIASMGGYIDPPYNPVRCRVFCVPSPDYQLWTIDH